MSTKLAECILQSGRCAVVSVTNQRDMAPPDEVVIEVSERGEAIHTRTKTIPVKGFPLFTRPLAKRIRAAVVELDREIEEWKRPPVPPPALVDAAHSALYGSPCDGGGHDHPHGFREPPLAGPTEPPS